MDDENRVRELIAELDKNDFTIRDRATEELEAMGPGVVPQLREALDVTTSPEQRLRLQTLQDSFEPSLFVPKGEALRAIRALQILEIIGTDSARQVLKIMKDESPWPRVSREAGGALQRLRVRSTR